MTIYVYVLIVAVVIAGIVIIYKPSLETFEAYNALYDEPVGPGKIKVINRGTEIPIRAVKFFLQDIFKEEILNNVQGTENITIEKIYVERDSELDKEFYTIVFSDPKSSTLKEVGLTLNNSSLINDDSDPKLVSINIVITGVKELPMPSSVLPQNQYSNLYQMKNKYYLTAPFKVNDDNL